MEPFVLCDPRAITRLNAPRRLAVWTHTIGKRGVLPAGCGVVLVGFLGIRYQIVGGTQGLTFLVRDDVEDHAEQP